MLDLAIQIPLVCDVEAMTPSSKYVLSALVSSAGMLSSTAIEVVFFPHRNNYLLLRS